MAKKDPNIKETVLDILNNWGKSQGENKVTLNKFDKVLSLISCNIKMSDGNKNFDTNEFRVDKSSVFNFKMKYNVTGEITKEDINHLNLFFQKHKNIAKMLIGN